MTDAATLTRPTFHALTIAAVRELTADSVEITFDVPAELADAYRHHPGQHLTVRMIVDGREQRRSYSITTPAGEPSDAPLAIGVRCVPGGRVSEPLTRRFAEGQQLDVMTPAGRFMTEVQPDAARSVVLIGAGSGITPLLSIARSVLAGEPGSTVTLLYGNRSIDSIMFREELDELKDTYIDRFTLVHVLSRERRNIDLLDGRLDRERVARLAGALFDAATVDDVFICGPDTLPEDVSATMIELGVPAERVHVELFTPVAGAAPRDMTRVDASGRPTAHTKVVATAAVVVNGLEREVRIHEGERVLDAAIRDGLDVPWACTGGVCATCRACVTEGEVTMVSNHALTDAEVTAGFALTCQSLPATDRLRVDYDRV